jgi:gliding motility-associated-like protein
LLTQPNPAWYYLQIDQSGNLDITISQVDNNGSGIDVDFIAWGPFASPTGPCTAGLTSGNTVDCSYSTAATEVANITGAVTGEYYILLITNYANQSGNITFSQTGGTGSTDCSIVTPSCPTVGFHGEDSGGNSYNLPLSLDCTTDGWLFLRANDASTAGGPITPTAVVNVTTNGNGSGNNMYGYENNGGTWNAYWGSSNVPSNTNFSFTMYEMDNVTASSFAVEMCDVTSGADMSFTIQDGNCGGSTITTGTWVASDGTNSGAAGPIWDGTGSAPGTTSGCYMVSFPTSAVSGSASYSCPTCPPSSFVTTDFGWAYFNPAEAGPGMYDITYSWDDGCGCSGSATETITVNNPYDATFSYASAQYCSDASDPTPTVTQTGGTFSSTAGLSLNTSSGAIDLSASTPGIYNVTYSVGGGATDYSGNCNDSHVEQVEILAPPTADAGSPFTITCVSNVGGSAIGTSSTAGLSYSWSPTGGLSSSTASNPTANPTSTTTYTVTTSYTSLPSCSATDNVTVTVDNTDPTADAGSPVVIDCNSTSGQESLDGSGSTGSMNYAWTTGGGNIVSGGTTTTPTVNAAGTYTITVTNPSNGCSATDNVTVTTDLTAPTADAGADVVIDCNSAGGQESLDGSGSTGSMNYAWTTGGGNIVSGSATNTAVVDAAGTYTITVTDPSNGCSATDDAIVTTDLTAPTADAGPDVTIDCNSTGGQESLDGSGSTGSMNYAWTTGGGNIVSGGATNTAVVDAAGTYTITVTDPSNGCSATDDAIVSTDLTAPTADAGPDVIIDCNSTAGQESLDGSGSTGGMTYAWTTGGGNIVSGGATNTAVVDANGTYTLTVTDASNGCSATDDADVTTDLSTPTASIAAPSQIDCVSPSTTVDGSGSTNSAGGTTGLTYSWTASNGGVISGSSTSATCTATAAGDYTLVVTQANGCTDTQMVTVTADASVPTAIITGDATLTCTTTAITLDGSTSLGSSLSYEWQDGTSATVGTNSTLGVSTPDTYTLIVTNTSNSCTNSTSVIISQDITTPSVVVNGPLVVDCNNPVVVLDGSGSDQGANFAYTWTNAGTGAILGVGSADTDSTSTADTYTLTILNTTNGCSDFADITVTMDTVSPSADAGVDVNFPCGVPTVALDGSASTGTGINYDWTGPGIITNGTSATPDVDGTGTFTLTVTASNGCTDTDDVDVIPDSNAPVADAGTDITVTCNDLPWNVTLDGSGSDNGANITYAWSTTGTGVITNGTTTSPSVDQEGAYTITVTNTSNSCTATATVNVVTDTVSPVADAGLDGVITCTSGLVTTIDGTASTGSNITYNWTTSNGTIDSQSSGTATVSAAGDYDLTVTADNGCTDTDQVSVTMDTLSPVVNIAAPADLDCQGNPVTLDGSASTGTNETYLWSDASTNNTTSVTTAGTYTLTVTNDNGCSSSASVTVNNVAGPVADFTGSPTSGNIPLDVDFTDNSTGTNLTYDWNFGDNNTSTQQHPSNTFITVGTFDVILTVTDDNGCTDSDTLVVSTDGESMLIVPNIFSPNNDGNNDIFNIQGTNILEIKGTIFNRWGQVVYEFDALGAGWDGHTISGAEAASGTYYYIIDAVGADGIEYNYQGPFQLVK